MEICRIVIRSEEEELDAEVAQAVYEATSLFADLMAPGDDDYLPETSAGSKVQEDAASIVIKELSVRALFGHDVVELCCTMVGSCEADLSVI